MGILIIIGLFLGRRLLSGYFTCTGFLPVNEFILIFIKSIYIYAPGDPDLHPPGGYCIKINQKE
jgi:hypothetical protein